ncbi:MAG TPA: twin-arginine translocase subunit TatC [Candidatus Omnitrophica bacterium]|nr:twin-arginine translocase subunit TatC [Candidatus Omnitrophota bacterium]
MKDEKLSLVEHLDELRSCIIRSLIFLVICSIAIYSFSDKILPSLIKPAGKLVFIAPQEAFIANIKIALFVGLIISSPFILYQVWKFISSGLMIDERRLIYFFGPVSFLLFASGLIFGYSVITPLGVKFLLGFETDFLTPMISISNYISFVASLSFAFAIVFQLPIALIFLTKVGIVTPATLAARRREAIVLVFIAAALMTPPDVVTQVLMALPLILLYEMGVIFSKFTYKKRV